MKREADLIDVWFDSGSMPCTMALSFENKIKLTQIKISEISLLKVWIRLGWFYTLHAIATLVLIK
jgi:isoleucyl-tRNA synthetase